MGPANARSASTLARSPPTPTVSWALCLRPSIQGGAPALQRLPNTPSLVVFDLLGWPIGPCICVFVPLCLVAQCARKRSDVARVLCRWWQKLQGFSAVGPSGGTWDTGPQPPGGSSHSGSGTSSLDLGTEVRLGSGVGTRLGSGKGTRLGSGMGTQPGFWEGDPPGLGKGDPPGLGDGDAAWAQGRGPAWARGRGPAWVLGRGPAWARGWGRSLLPLWPHHSLY